MSLLLKEMHPPATINIPIEATTEGSTCNETFPGDAEIKIQRLRLNFWGTWWADFRFTQDKNKLGAPSLQQYFNMYQVVVFADYHANESLFAHPISGFSKIWFNDEN
jgi:hypothetical protein